MYFTSRAEAGKKLAATIPQYDASEVIVIALSEGAVIVGQEIALALGCPLTLLLSENIHLPGEQSNIGTVIQDGNFAYDNTLSSGEVEEYYAEFHSYIEDQKREKFEKINRLLGEEGTLHPEQLRNKILILVSDGLKTGTSLEAAHLFLKPIQVKRLIIATPIASVQAVDRMHILADELHCLGVTENYITTNHYYDQNTLLSHEQIVQVLHNMQPRNNNQDLFATS